MSRYKHIPISEEIHDEMKMRALKEKMPTNRYTEQVLKEVWDFQDGSIDQKSFCGRIKDLKNAYEKDQHDIKAALNTERNLTLDLDD